MYDCDRYEKADYAPFSELQGATLAAITGKVGDDEMEFRTTDGRRYTLRYYDDCCASCSIEDICGDLADLIGSPILMAEEVSSKAPNGAVLAERKARYEQALADYKPAYVGDTFDPYGPRPDNNFTEESETWTFYKLATILGSVTIRWYGSSNGYYSESATFERWKT